MLSLVVPVVFVQQSGQVLDPDTVSFVVLLYQSAAVNQFHDLPPLTHEADASHSSNRRC